MLHPSKALNAWYYLAITYTKLGNRELAEQYFRKLIRERIRYLGTHNLALTEDYAWYAGFLKTGANRDSCLEYYRKALTIRIDILGLSSRYAADSYMLLGDCWNEWGYPDSALYYYQEALHSLSSGYDRTDIYGNPASGEVSDRKLFALTLKGKAEALQKLGEKDTFRMNDCLKGALSCCEQLFGVIDDLRNTSLTEEGRLFISDNERNTYNRAVGLALMLYNRTGENIFLDKSFRIAEKAKYTTLLMAVRENNALSVCNVPDSVQAILKDIKYRISSSRDRIREEELSGNPDTGKIRLWQEEVYSLDDHEGQIIKSLEADYPDYYQLKYNTKVPGAEEILANLKRNERMIEYYLTGDALIAFVFSSGKVTVKEQRVDSSFLVKMGTMRDFCYNNTLVSHRKGQAENFRRIAAELYDILIRPCEVRQGEKLIVIPDAAMNYLPFDALLEDSTITSIYYKDYPFLVRSNPVIYTYSANLYLNKQPGRKLRTGGLLAMAPSYENDKGNASATRELLINRQELGPLQGTVEEITGIQRIIGGRTVSGYEASEHLFKQLAPGCSILHMAMHASMDDTDPLYSKLVFSDNPEGGEDGFLNVYEIYDLELEASMVVLSACQTGAGIVRMGEGIMSLARAFYYSGVPNVVMSLWAVSDTSGRKLMVDFYDLLSHGLDKGRAMQKAKLRYLESADPLMQQPYYWAGYVVTGDHSSVFLPRVTWPLIATAVLITLLVVILLIRNRLKKHKLSFFRKYSLTIR